MPRNAKPLMIASRAGNVCGGVAGKETEFGMEVAAGKLDVQVFVGEIEVTLPAQKGAHAGGESKFDLTAGKTLHHEPGKPARRPAESTRQHTLGAP